MAAVAAATAAATTAVELAAGRGIGGGNGGGRLARCHQTADSLCAAGLPISGKGRTYGTALSTVVRARALRGGGRRGGAPVGGAPEQERPASGSWRKLVSSPRGAGDEPRLMSRSFGTISAICRRTRGRDRRSARLISGTGTGRQAAHRIHKIRVLRSHPTSMMLSPPTPGIGGEVARSESKQGGAQGLGREMQAARERCQGSRLSGGDPGDVGFYLGVVLAMPMVPLASSRASGKVFK